MNKVTGISAVVGILSFCWQNSATAITLEFSPSNQTSNLGSEVMFDLVISDLGNNIAPSLGEFDLILEFDSSIIAFDSLEFGEQLNQASSTFAFRGETLVNANALNLFEISGELSSDLIQLQPSSFTLATFTFDSIGVGTSELTLDNVILGDETGSSLSFLSESSSITVISDVSTTVPEASTIWALISFSLCSFFRYQRHTSRK